MRFVFDLDGTLADCQHRVPMIDGTDAGYRRFFASCTHDKPIRHVIDVAASLIECGHVVEVWSGRSDEVREQTEAWLMSNGIPRSCLTRMRQAGDHRPDDVVKRQMLHDATLRDMRPDVVFDDRDRVVAMWRAEGVPCFQVAPGDF
jgi:hypothetical protein